VLAAARFGKVKYCRPPHEAMESWRTLAENGHQMAHRILVAGFADGHRGTSEMSRREQRSGTGCEQRPLRRLQHLLDVLATQRRREGCD
jgi:hypothetical protein